MFNLDSIFNPLTHWCLATRSEITVELFRKTKACLILWFATALFMWGYVLLSYFGFSESEAYKGGFLFSASHFLVPALFRRDVSVAKIGIFISLTGLAWQFWFCYYSGGVYSPAAVWFTIHPVILGFFGNAILVYISVLINAGVIGGLYYLEHAGLLPADQLGDRFSDVMIISTFIGLDILIAAFTLMAVTMNRKQNDEISEAKDHIENLIKILSHDISNPLTVMKIILESHQSPSEPIGEKKFKLMTNAYNDMEGITNSVKEWLANSTYQFAKIDEIVSIDEIEEHIRLTFDEKINDKGLSLLFSRDARLSTFKTNKMVLLHNVINNLISNAIKFSHRGKSIFVKFTGNSSHIKIFITDQGVGIPEDVLEKIFDPDLKTTSTGTDGEAGTGFGLPIAKKMIKQINGDLEFESNIYTQGTERFGTRATITLVIM